MLLRRWARRAQLPGDAAALLPGIVAATVALYGTLRARVLPTPAKSHYLYNVRAMRSIFQARTVQVQTRTIT